MMHGNTTSDCRKQRLNGVGKEYIPLADREAFIQACPKALRAFVQAMQYLGARPSELRRLRVSDMTKEGVSLTTYKGEGQCTVDPTTGGFNGP